MGRYEKSTHIPFSHRVDTAHTAPVLPRDVWQGSTFREANGDELEVVWNGHRDGPTLCGPIERSSESADLPVRIHLPRTW
jgi:hypothetical protein